MDGFCECLTGPSPPSHQSSRLKVIAGGSYDRKTRYIEPTVIHCKLGSPLMADETFGPILAVTEVPSVRAAIREINSRPKPLALYVFSNDKTVQHMVLHNTSSGGVTINAALFHVGHPELPFGGVGNSGMGRYHGELFREACQIGTNLFVHAIFFFPPFPRQVRL